MAASIATITTTVQEIQATGDLVLKTLAGIPAIGTASTAAESILDITAQLLESALKGLKTAQGTAITVASVQALLPDQTPVAPPTT